MKHTDTLTSLLTILFTTFHLANDIVFGMSPRGLSNLPVVVVWVHMMGKSSVVDPRVAQSGGAFSFVWTLLAVGATVNG